MYIDQRRQACQQADWVCGECQCHTPSVWTCPHCFTLLCEACDDRRYEHTVPAGPRAGQPCDGGTQAAVLAVLFGCA